MYPRDEDAALSQSIEAPSGASVGYLTIYGIARGLAFPSGQFRRSGQQFAWLDRLGHVDLEAAAYRPDPIL